MKKTRLLEIIQEEIVAALGEAATTYAGKTSIDDLKKDKAFGGLTGDAKADATEKLSSGGTVTIGEDQLDEMAKITGRLEAAIKKVLSANKDLDGLPLKKAIKADAEVEDALEGDTMYDNQLNKFIALVRGEREVGQRGRKADPTKAKAEPKAKAKAEPKAKAAKASTKDMDDEDKAAAASIGKDETAKELGKTAPKDKIEKFNLGLKFIKKYKDDKPKIDAYLKKAKEEYKLPTTMMKDLKKAAGRDVGI
jgi:hypothetical protein